MKIKKSVFCLLAVACFVAPAISSCGTVSSVGTSSKAPDSSVASSVNDGSSSVAYTPDLSKKVTVTMDCYYNSSATMMTFPTGFNKTLADGNTYGAGDFKPVWKQVQKNLNFTIADHTLNKGSVDKDFTALQGTAFKDGNTLINIAQGNSDAIIKEGTTAGTILNLTNYLDKLPNFSAFLDENPVVKKQIVDSNGAIYYAPYFDGMNDMEKTLIMRKDWVSKLLDGAMPTGADTAKVITPSYARFDQETVDQDVDILVDGAKGKVHKKYASGKDIITIQNALATKDGTSLIKALRDYIDATYKDADGNAFYGSKRSELFVGGKAAFNVDELVALYRCVRTCPTLLTGTDQDLYPLIPRESANNRIGELLNFMQYFGCRGFNSRNTYFYIDDDGKVADIRNQPQFVKGMTALQNMYKEGLVLKDFDTKTAGGVTDGKFAVGLLKTGKAFSEHDYVQTQTIYNSATDAAEGLSLVPTYPAGYAWDGAKESKYLESWRSVKTQGWFITKDTDKDADVLNRCLALFDYFWSEEGNTLMSYGPAAWIDGTIDYMGKKVPALSADCLNELKTLAAGNYTNYYRQILGGTFPIGYVKEQGMEYQTVDSTAKSYLNQIETAIGLGIIDHPTFKLSSKNANHRQDLFPTTLAFTKGDQDTITATYSALSEYFTTDSKKTNMLNNVILKGWDGADPTNYTSSATYLTYVNETLKAPGYLALVQAAYDSMKLVK